MDYEKKYKEALKWVREIYPTMTGCDKEDAEHYFPELKKTKDERIRKALIENFKFFGGDHLETSKWGRDDDLLVTDILAYLEKQSEEARNIALPKDEVSDDLELAAERYACRYADSKYGHDKIKKAYTAGAQWQKEQMMKALLDMEKDSVEVEHKYGEGGRELYLKMLGILRPFEED